MAGTYVAKALIQDKVEFDRLFVKRNITARVVCQQMRQLPVLCERMDDLDWLYRVGRRFKDGIQMIVSLCAIRLSKDGRLITHKHRPWIPSNNQLFK